ncbi:MAG: maleylpyruvate isomerase N-terminal domain-containing protein [Chloroflexi bacterium]|nr:maleylpyruvate isomerase N-terminal domain-containing protein [Chloroflexota bacterium]
MNTEAVAEMLREDRAEWEALVEVLEAHPDGALHDPTSPAWTSRDVYAHLARWIEHSTGQFEAFLAGRELTTIEGTDDEINARWQQEDSGLSHADARARAQQAFERRLRAFEAVPADRWDDAVRAFAGADGSEHYAAHRSYIADATP